MYNKEEAINQLLNVVGADFNILFKKNDKGIVTLTFEDEDTHEKVNFKYNTKNITVTIAPREMSKETFQYNILPYITKIKEILLSLNIEEI